jgi:hypothetical protein
MKIAEPVIGRAIGAVVGSADPASPECGPGTYVGAGDYLMATTEETAMKLTTFALAAVFALTSTFAFAHSHHRHHHYWMHGGSGGPNGTAGGPTSLSGTGSSQFGGSTPGAAGRN